MNNEDFENTAQNGDLVEDIVRHLNNHSMYRGTKRLAEVVREIREKTKDARDIDGALPAIQDVLKRLGKHHGVYKAGWINDIDKGVSDIAVDRVALNNRIAAVITMPQLFRVSEPKAHQWAVDGYNLIKAEDEKGYFDYWVLNLRKNSGGRLGEMIAALSGFLEDGRLLTFCFSGGKSDWILKDGTVELENCIKPHKYFREPFKLKNRNKPIELWVGPLTASAGESLCLIFAHQERLNVKILGEKTCGCSDTNQFFALSNGMSLSLVTGPKADSNGQAHLHNFIWPKRPLSREAQNYCAKLDI